MTEIPSPAHGDILVVDDNVNNLKTIEQLLLDAGHQARCATNERTALMLAAARRPELILLDVRMPGRNGYELCADLKANPEFKSIPVIFLSAASELRDKLAGFKAGGVDYILKPFEVDDVLIRIETHLKLHRLQIALADAYAHVEQQVLERTRELQSVLDALQQSERNYRGIFNATNDALFIHDTRGRIMDVNERMCALFGCDRAKALTLSLKDLSLGEPPYTQTEAETRLRLAFEQGPQVFEWRSRRGNGEWFWTEVALRACEIAGQQRVIASVRDISRRKNAEAALRASAEQHKKILRAAMDGFLLLDHQGRILEVNDAYCRMSGYGEPELLAMGIGDLEETEDPAAIAAHLRKIKDQGEDRFETVHRRKNGTRFHVEIATQFRPGEGGQWVVFARDVTERKRIETKLREAQKMESIGHLAGGVAHDFNNILAATMMQLSLLRGNPHLDPETREVVADLEANSKRAANLTRQLLMFSRRSVMEVKVLDLNEVIANLLKMLRRLIDESINLEFDPGDQLPLIEADAGMLEQVLMNLAVNARDAMPRGGRLSMLTRGVEIDASQGHTNPDTYPGTFVCLSITDTGCGMDEDTVKHIFEPFFTTKDVGKGTGLGLATVYGIVAQHKGWIQVESRVGHGTTFRVFLPTSREALPAPASGAGKQDFSGTESILVVEDDFRVRRALALCLKGLGYQVFEAGNGREALALWQEHRPAIDLLLSDMVMPEGMTGMELAEKLLAQKPALKIIISSGYSAEISRDGQTTKDGFVFLSKPYPFPLLGQRIRECLDGK